MFVLRWAEPTFTRWCKSAGSCAAGVRRNTLPELLRGTPRRTPGGTRRNCVLRFKEIGDAVECLVVDEDRAEERLFGLDVVRRHTERLIHGAPPDAH